MNEDGFPISDVEVSLEIQLEKIDTLEQTYKANLAVTLKYNDGEESRLGPARLEPWPQEGANVWTPLVCTWDEFEDCAADSYAKIHKVMPKGVRLFRYTKAIFGNYLLDFAEFPFDQQKIDFVLHLDPEPHYVLRDVCVYDLETEFEIVKIHDRHEPQAKVGTGALELTLDRFTVSVTVKRHPKFYLLNFFFITFCLVLLQCTCVGIDIDDLSARIQTTLSLLLTLAAFKISVATQVPKSTEQTLLDKQVMYAFVFLSIGALQSLVISFDVAENSLMEEMDLYFTLLFGFSWIMMNRSMLRGKQRKHSDERKPGMLGLPSPDRGDYRLTRGQGASRSYWVRRSDQRYATF